MEQPPADVVAWAERQLDVRVVGTTPMSGGIDAHMFRLSLDGRSDVVLRISQGGDWDDIEQHSSNLRLLADTQVPAPQLLVVDPAVGDGRHPVMLQTLLPGDPSLPPEPTTAWLDSLAAMLLRIQAVDLQAWMPDRASYRWAQLDDEAEQELSGADVRLLQSLRNVRGRVPLTRVFVHDDFWIGNTLRAGDVVVGVVDWAPAGAGSAARDATYCAVDMSLCYGLDIGDSFLAGFRTEVDVPDEEVAAWTARAVLMSRHFAEWMSGWNGLGIPVTVEDASARRQELLERTLSRLR